MHLKTLLEIVSTQDTFIAFTMETGTRPSYPHTRTTVTEATAPGAGCPMSRLGTWVHNSPRRPLPLLPIPKPGCPILSRLHRERVGSGAANKSIFRVPHVPPWAWVHNSPRAASSRHSTKDSRRAPCAFHLPGSNISSPYFARCHARPAAGGAPRCKCLVPKPLPVFRSSSLLSRRRRSFSSCLRS